MKEKRAKEKDGQETQKVIETWAAQPLVCALVSCICYVQKELELTSTTFQKQAKYMKHVRTKEKGWVFNDYVGEKGTYDQEA